jgi:tetratricopeptide (TPR) repeat protein
MRYHAEARKHIFLAMRYIDRVSERERLRIQGDFYNASGNRARAIETYEKILDLYPEDWIANNSLGLIYNGMGDLDRGIERLAVNVRNKVENPYSYENISFAYRAKGMYDKTEQILRDYLKNISEHMWIYWQLAHTYLCQGELGLAMAEINNAISLSPENASNISLKGDVYLYREDFDSAEAEFRRLLAKDEPAHQRIGRHDLAHLYLLQGRFEDAKEQVRQGIRLAEEQGENSWILRFARYLAYLHLKTGNYAEALIESQRSRSIAEKGGNEGGLINGLFWEGISHLKLNAMGASEKTAEILKERIEQGSNKKLMGFYFLLKGHIELEKKNSVEAIGNFEQAKSLLPFQKGSGDDHALFSEPLAYTYYELAEIDKAQQEHEYIISLTSGRLLRGDIYAKSFYMLGKIYEQKDWRGKAIEHYGKFLDLWKDADPGLPEVADARERLQALR